MGANVATADEILAALAAGEEAPDEETPAGDGSENSAIKQIRESQKMWEKKAKELAKENKTLLDFKVQTEEKARRDTVSAVFTELELPEKQAELFLKTHDGEVTSDAIRQFVVDFGLKDLSEQGDKTTEEKSQGFTPGGTGGGNPPPAEVFDLNKAMELASSDPAKLEKMFSEGRLKLETLPGNE